jgi:hypothetical protein
MTTTFTDIKIIGMDDAASRPGDLNSAIVNVTFRLSAVTPSEWANYFNAAWQQHIYMMKRRARVFGRTLEIECVPSEIENDHLPELKKIIAETNRAYSEYADVQARQRETEAARNAATALELKDVSSRLKFD